MVAERTSQPIEDRDGEPPLSSGVGEAEFPKGLTKRGSAAAAGKVRGGALRVRAYVASPDDLKQLNAPPAPRAAQRVADPVKWAAATPSLADARSSFRSCSAMLLLTSDVSSPSSFLNSRIASSVDVRQKMDTAKQASSLAKTASPDVQDLHAGKITDPAPLPPAGRAPAPRRRCSGLAPPPPPEGL